MPLSDVFEKLGRAIFESPFAAARVSEEVPELAEIRLAAIDAIKAKSHKVAGRMVFPFNLVRIHLSGVPEKQAETFRSGFLSKYFNGELRAALTRFNVRYPEELQVDIETNPDLPGPEQDWIRIETQLVAKAPAGEASDVEREGTLVVVQGEANLPEIPLRKVRTNIGRVMDVFKTTGPSRRNDITFATDTEINRTVSREHAHVLREKSEYRIYNDRWYKMGEGAEASCGLWIVRGGLSQPVHRNSRGAALLNGDEIHLGRAVVLFRV